MNIKYIASCAQEAMWLSDGLNSESKENELNALFKVDKYVNISGLCYSFIHIVNQHPELKACFQQRENDLVKYDLESITVDDVIRYHHEVNESDFVRKVLSYKFNLKEEKCLINLHLCPLKDCYLVAIRIHHIISDFYSVENIITELFGETQQADIQGSQLGELEAGYLKSEACQNDMTFWKNNLSQSRNLLDFSSGNQSVHSPEGRISRTQISGEIYSLIKRYCCAENISPARLLSQIFAMTLYRLTGQNEFCLGLSASMRKNFPQVGYGYAVNVLPVRYRFSPELSVASTLQAGNKTILEALRHASLPLKKIAEICAPERVFAANPLFNVCFNYQATTQLYEGSLSSLLYGSTGRHVTIGNTVLQPVPLDQIDCQFDLMMVAEETTDGFDVFLLSRNSVMDQQKAGTILTNFVHFIHAFLQQPELPLSGFSFSTAKNNCPVSGKVVPVQRTLVDWLNETADKYPDHTAVTFNQTRMTYRELFCRAEYLACSLIGMGVKPGDKIPLCFNPGPDMIVAIIAVLKCGGCYVPVNPAYPDTRVTDILADIRPRLGLAEESLRARFLPSLDQVVTPDLTLSADLTRTTGSTQSGPQIPADVLSAYLPEPEDLAYIIYTSGSTGKPKGVEICHRNVVRLFTSSDSGFGFSCADVWTLYHSFAFDFSVWEIFGALLYGGRLVIVPYLISRSPEEFAQLVEKEQVTVLNQTPTAFARFSGSSIRHGLALNHLRFVIFGGEALDLAGLSPWYASYGERINLINMYGITETTVHVTYRRLAAKDCSENKGSLIGLPLSDLAITVMDAFGHPLPVGWPGEMYVAGEGLAKGYFNRESLTRERFIEKSFSGEVVRLYRSGDLARFINEQEIEYLGRIDNQVKIRGFRIELGDIKAKLTEIDAVSHAFVTTGKAGEETVLLAYLLLNQEITYEKVTEEISSELPDYMIPQSFYITSEIPLTVNNKVDMKRLHQIAEKLLPSVRHQVAESEVERTVLSAWKRVLKLDEIDLESDFFSLGGNSGSVLKIYHDLNDTYNNILMVADLFKHRNIRSLSRHISKQQSSEKNESSEKPLAARMQKRIDQIKQRKQRQQRLSEA